MQLLDCRGAVHGPEIAPRAKCRLQTTLNPNPLAMKKPGYRMCCGEGRVYLERKVGRVSMGESEMWIGKEGGRGKTP